MNITLAARAFCHARKTYYEQFQDYFRNQVQQLDAARFWQLHRVFIFEVYAFRFRCGRTNGIEQAAGELFRKAYAQDFITLGGPKVPEYSIDEALQFAKSWSGLVAQLYRPLFHVVTGRSDDSYGDLLDALPLAGQDIVDRALASGSDNKSAFRSNDDFEQSVRNACQSQTKLAELILHGENNVAQSLFDAGRDFFASQAAESINER